MLKGRESLLRLIGKRRRILSSSRGRLLLSSTTVTSATNSSVDAHGDEGEGITEPPVKRRLKERETIEEEIEEEVKKSPLVICPVCGKRVNGGDYPMNSHLDTCLTTGAKRKLTQGTLLQFNFAKDNVSHNDEIVSNPDPTLTDSLDEFPLDISHPLASEDDKTSASVVSISEITFDTMERSDSGSPRKLATDIRSVRLVNEDISREKILTDIEMNKKTEKASSLLSEIQMSALDTEKIMVEVSEALLETYIVGRRFVDEVDIKSGGSILLLRDPNNIKDPNAIKVLDAEFHHVLGFLPRSLSLYLSLLIDDYQMIFEGTISSVPKHSLDVVPITLTCHKTPLNGDIVDNCLDSFKSLWKNVICSITDGKHSPPSLAKYQQNFHLMMQEVSKSNSHLFTEDERCFLENFNSLSDDSQRLFIRLYMRKGPWFRLSSISYPEVLDVQQAAMGLSGYVCLFNSQNFISEDDLGELLNVMTVSELREIQGMFKKKCRKSTRKKDFITSLISLYKNEKCSLPSMVMQKTGISVRISLLAESLLWRVQRLFFLNGDQDLSSFLLVDLGIIKYPTYSCVISHQLFRDRCHLQAYEEAIEVAQIMDESLDQQNHATVLKCIEISQSLLPSSHNKKSQSSTSEPIAPFLLCFSAPWVYSKVVFLGISFLEQQRRYAEAIKLLKQLLLNFTQDRRRGYWTLRLSIDLEHTGHIDESLCIAEAGLTDPWVRAGSKMALQRRVIRLGKPPRRWKVPSFSHCIKMKIPEVHVQGRPLNCETGAKSRFYGEDGEQCGVEQLALHYYGDDGWQGAHTESGIWLTIFGLMMWDIIFADVPDVFRSKFQSAPLDLETDGFYNTREGLIESHLKGIHDGMGEMLLIMSWECHLGTACRGVNWDRHTLFELRAAVSCIGGPCLASLLRLLSQDYRSWSSGMPDLLLWRFNGEYKGEAKLVEVKGPRDKLSEQQRAWLLVLMDYGFNVEVCKVSPSPPVESTT